MKLLLISLDGLWEKDFPMLENLPNIGRMIRGGVSCQRVQTIYPALTYPVHATILTGCMPTGHGIAHNQPFVPGVLPKDRPWYWDASAIHKPTIHEIVREHGGRTASILWPVTGKSHSIRWNFPEVLALEGENQTLKMLRFGSAAWILAMELRCGRQRKSIHQPDLDDYAALLAQKLLKKRRPPDLITLHLVDCDEMRHLYGADSPEAADAIRRLDGRVGRLLAALDWGNRHDTVVALVSDHGLADVSRPVSLDAALREADFGDECHAQSNGMGAYFHFARDAQEKVAEVRCFLEENKDRLGISAVYDGARLQRMGAAKQIRLAAEAAPEVVFVDDLATEKRLKATHGFGPDHPAAQCLLIMAGPGIRNGVALPSAQMVDIAPTLMHAAGYTMPTAQGQILADCFEK